MYARSRGVFAPAFSALAIASEPSCSCAAGRIIASGGKELAIRLEEEGYAPIMREAGLQVTDDDDAAPEPVEPEAAHS